MALLMQQWLTFCVYWGRDVIFRDQGAGVSRASSWDCERQAFLLVILTCAFQKSANRFVCIKILKTLSKNPAFGSVWI